MAEKKAVVMFRCTQEEKKLLRILAARFYTNLKSLILGMAEEFDREGDDRKRGFGLSGNKYFNHD